MSDEKTSAAATIVISRNTNEQELFTSNYAKFRELLSSIIEELLAHLVASNVISFDEEEEIMSQATSSSKIRAVLMPIRKALFEGIPRPFHELLRIMRSSQHVECVEFAKRIISEANIDEYTETDTISGDWGRGLYCNDKYG